MSVSIEVDVIGAAEFTAALEQFDSAMQSRIQEQLTQWAQDVKVDAQRLVPVRTGYLQSTIDAKSQQWQSRSAPKQHTPLQSNLAPPIHAPNPTSTPRLKRICRVWSSFCCKP